MSSANNTPTPNEISFINGDITPDESALTAQENSGETNRNQHIRYKGWLITTKLINGKLWLRWQHPQESFPRCSCPVSDRGLAETIRHVRFFIDLAIKLEKEADRF